MGDGKYKSKFVRCKNINYGKDVTGKFVCGNSGQRVIDKNIKPSYYSISCPSNTFNHNAKKRCRFEYSLEQQSDFTEDDDLSNEQI